MSNLIQFWNVMFIKVSAEFLSDVTSAYNYSFQRKNMVDFSIVFSKAF